jgi:hypothetical protein
MSIRQRCVGATRSHRTPRGRQARLGHPNRGSWRVSIELASPVPRQ